MTPSCAVVICTHTDERRPHIERAVASVRDQSTPPDEIVLVADHNEGLGEWARATFPGVTVVDNPNTRGESGARNAGVAATSSEVVAFLDDDAAAADDWLTHLLSWYQDPDVLGVGGSARPAWHSGRPTWFPREFDWVVGCTYRGLPERPSGVRNLMGCNMSFRRSVIIDAGGFDEGLGRTGGDALGCSETEFCIRATQLLDGRLVFDPRASIDHHVPAGRTTWRYFVTRCRAEGRSKARMAHRTPRREPLHVERTYVTGTLAQGVVRRVGRLGRERGAVLRVATIVVGAGVTAASFALNLPTGRAAR